MNNRTVIDVTSLERKQNLERFFASYQNQPAMMKLKLRLTRYLEQNTEDGSATQIKTKEAGE